MKHLLNKFACPLIVKLHDLNKDYKWKMEETSYLCHR